MGESWFPGLFVMEMIKKYLRLLTIVYGQPMNLENILEKIGERVTAVFWLVRKNRNLAYE
ncbi:hypothetical protein SD77_0760 [Bacillus badius]|uniref:Mobile element protein n=1 Tax=Bacillus badius TaxID=1455 RepID=A0ABR5AU37_BACBA|nr:hypothetical protein SD78_3994 [Bacillus badius]KIL78159.1 hypothetical protein SD77_0760 [Bacillus badius]